MRRHKPSLPDPELPESKAPPRRMDPLVIEAAARAGHEALRAYRLAQGDRPLPCWDAALPGEEAARHESHRAHCRTHVVRLCVEGMLSREVHEAWRQAREAEGWIHGALPDEVQKTNPNLIPYEDLPAKDRRAMELWDRIVAAMVLCLEAAEPA